MPLICPAPSAPLLNPDSNAALQAAAAAARLLRDVAEGPAQGRAAVMGFDVEWVPMARPGRPPMKGRGGEVCLLQLAGRSVSVIIDLCAWFTRATPQPALLQVGTASTKAGQEVWQNPDAGGQCMTRGQGEDIVGGERVYESEDAALCSGSLGDAAGFQFDRLAAEAALDDFLAATLLRDDVLKVMPLDSVWRRPAEFPHCKTKELQQCIYPRTDFRVWVLCGSVLFGGRLCTKTQLFLLIQLPTQIRIRSFF